MLFKTLCKSLETCFVCGCCVRATSTLSLFLSVYTISRKGTERKSPLRVKITRTMFLFTSHLLAAPIQGDQLQKDFRWKQKLGLKTPRLFWSCGWKVVDNPKATDKTEHFEEKFRYLQKLRKFKMDHTPRFNKFRRASGPEIYSSSIRFYPVHDRRVRFCDSNWKFIFSYYSAKRILSAFRILLRLVCLLFNKQSLKMRFFIIPQVRKRKAVLSKTRFSFKLDFANSFIWRTRWEIEPYFFRWSIQNWKFHAKRTESVGKNQKCNLINVYRNKPPSLIGISFEPCEQKFAF